MAKKSKTYTLKEATVRCGYRRDNTMREKHLSTDEERDLLGHHFHDGRVHLDAQAIESLAKELAAERQARGNWRVLNLGEWAQKTGEGRPGSKK